MIKETIYREDAIKAVWGDDINPNEDGMVFEAQSHIDRDIRLIPSADRPQGEWINDTRYSGWTCTHCNYHDGNQTDNFCPNCGAKMKGADDDL